MKKILTIFSVMLMILFAFAIEVNAYTYNIGFNAQKANLNPGNTVTIDVNLSNLKMDSNESGIIGFEAVLDYDSEVFSKVAVKGEDKWSGLSYVSSSKKLTGFIISKENSVNESGDIATITLTVGENAKLGETVVKLKDIKTSNGTTVTANDASVKFEIVKAEESNDNNENNDIADEINKQAIQAFNANFESYAGNEVTSSQVKALIRQVEASNASNSNKVELTGITKVDDVVNSDKYTVTIFKHGSDADGDCNRTATAEGYVCHINIDKNDSTNKDTNKEENKNNTTNTNKDNTVANKVISAAGLENISALAVGALVVISGVSYMSYKKYKNM